MEAELQRYDFVQFAMCDIHGIPRGKLVPREMVAQACQDGVGIFTGTQFLGVNCEPTINIKEFETFPNGAMRPLQASKVRPLEWSSGPQRKIGLVLCQMVVSPGVPLHCCPRLIAQRQVGRLAKQGWSIKSAYECEFNLLKKDTQEPYGVRSDLIPFANLDIMDQHSDLLTDMLNVLRSSGVRYEYFLPEYQAGQYEMSMQPQWGVESADDTFLLRYGVRSFCFRRGLQASFLAKPSPSHHTAGLHFNHSLWSQDGKTNLFLEPADPLKLSPMARHWLAGVLEHAPALMALASPTVNCYSRIGQGFAPGAIFWNVEDRLCAVRAKNAGNNVYLECRIPSSAGNPYLIMAGVIAAGLDGVERKLPCPDPGRPQSPKMLPASLGEALSALEEDAVMKEALGAKFVEYFAIMKREYEVKRFEQSQGDSSSASTTRSDDRLSEIAHYYLPLI